MTLDYRNVVCKAVLNLRKTILYVEWKTVLVFITEFCLSIYCAID